MNIYNDYSSGTILSQLDQTGGGGGGGRGQTRRIIGIRFPLSVLMVKVVACLSASGMLIYKWCGYSSIQFV